jgi:regulatory protein
VLETDGGQQDVAGAGLEQALAVAYRCLNRREFTRAEMCAHLERDGVDPPDIERAISALTEAGQLDDMRFARLFVQDKRELQEWGNDRIRRTLLGRGVDAGVVEDALSGQDLDDIDRAVALLRRRFPSLPLDRREHDRALGVLLRKGYEAEVALEALVIHTKGM